MSDLDSTTVVPSTDVEDEADLDRDTDIENDLGRRRWRMPRRGLLVNGGILVALLVVLALILLTLRGTGDEPTTAAQTSSVSTGEVTATVSANGNIAAGTAVNVDFQGNGGVVTAILVKQGQKVRKGQALARVDATSARQGLAQAQAQLDSARASYAGTVQGQTSAEQAVDARSVDQAEVGVSSAEASLRSANQSLALTRSQQNAAVTRAQRSLTSAQQQLDKAQAAYQADPTPENKQAVQTTKDEVSAARTALTLAKETRDSALLQARQQVTSAQQQLSSARASPASTRASVAVNQQGATASQVAQAQASVDSAEVGVEEAQTTLAQTTLRAPVAGRVAKVNGTVGEPSTSTSGSSSSSSSGTTSGSSTTDASGFVVLTGTNALQVTADVAEADIADVHVGQAATITLEASGAEISGKVTAVDSIETVTNNVVEYGVTVTLDSTKGVKLGQSTQVVVATGDKQDVTRVSSSALTTIGDRTTATVQHDDGSTETVQVTTGLEGDGFTEVLDGLADGDTVVIPEQADTGGGFTFPGAGGGFGGGLR